MWESNGFARTGLNYDRVEQEARREEIDYSRCVRRKIKALERYELKAQGVSNGLEGSTTRDRKDPKEPAKS